MSQSLYRNNPTTSVRSHPTCSRHFLCIKYNKFIPLLLGNPRRNDRSRKGETSAYPFLLPGTRAVVRRGDKDSESRVWVDNDTDADKSKPENPKSAVAKHKRRPMRYALFDSTQHGTHITIQLRND